MIDLVGDTDAAIDFLRRWHGEAPRTVITIHPETADTVRRDFQPNPTAEAAMSRFIDDAQGSLNIYTLVNRAKPGRTSPTKGEMEAALALHVDADFKDTGDADASLARMREYDPAPTVIIFSGGGYWPLWRFDAPLNGAADWREQIEAANVALHRALGANPACSNVNRLMRLPGTINMLNKKKRADGRQPALACIIEAHWDRTLSPGDAVARLPGAPARDAEPRTEIVENTPEKLQKLIKTGDASRWGGDRSDAVFSVACALVRLGWTDEQIVGVLLNPANGISVHVREQSKPNEYAARQALRARARVDADWERAAAGAIIADSQKNVRRALAAMGVSLRHNEFAMRSTAIIAGVERHLDDACGNYLRFQIDDRFGFRPSKDFAFDFLGFLARENSFHPVRDYLGGLVWDGVERIDSWLVTYCGAKGSSAADDDYKLTRAVGRLSLVAAVRRIYEPGCVFDELLVLIDQRQGTGKSSALRTLCPNPRWFTDDLPFGKPAKEIIEATVGKWIIEIAELSGMRRTEIDHIKAFLSRQAENARLAYGRLPTEVLRQWIPFGTTNQPIFLKDSQNRRYWPVVTGNINVEGIERDRDQLWAEAVHAHRRGESIRLDPKLWALATAAQEIHRETDPWVWAIGRLVGEQSDCHIATADLFDLLQLPNSAKNSGMSARLADVMRELGWNNNDGKVMKMGGNKVARGWRKGENWRRRYLVARWDDEVRQFLLVTVDKECPF